MPYQSQCYTGATEYATQRGAAELNSVSQTHAAQLGVSHMPQHSQYHAETANIDAQRTTAAFNNDGQSHVAQRTAHLPIGGHHLSSHTYPAYTLDFHSETRE